MKTYKSDNDLVFAPNTNPTVLNLELVDEESDREAPHPRRMPVGSHPRPLREVIVAEELDEDR